MANKIEQSFYSVYSYSGIESIEHTLKFVKHFCCGREQYFVFPFSLLWALGFFSDTSKLKMTTELAMMVVSVAITNGR